MSFLQREELLVNTPMSDVRYDNSFDLNNDDADWSDDDEMAVDGEDGFTTLPPGEEGMLQSHAGGEAIFHQIWDKAKPGYVFYFFFFSEINRILQKGRLAETPAARTEANRLLGASDPESRGRVSRNKTIGADFNA